MEPIKVGELKIDNMNGVNEVKTPSDSLEIKPTQADTSKDTQGSNEESGVTKHVVTYVGTSEFTDSTGHKWHHNDEVLLTDDEYAVREDLHFMVKYGEMKHTVVTM